MTYGKENKEDVSEQALELKYKSWVENDWKTGKGTAIKNWKSTLLNTLPHLPNKNLQNNNNLQNANTNTKSGKPPTIGGIEVAPLAKFLGVSPDDLSGFTANGGQ